MRKYQIGDLVAYAFGARTGAPAGPYEIRACLPRDDHAPEYAYRVKSAAEQMERVVGESQLTPYV